MSRPTVPPDFATDANYAAGSMLWSGHANKVSPGGLVQSGLVPASMVKAEHLNFLLNNHGAWLSYLIDMVLSGHAYKEDFFVDFSATSPLTADTELNHQTKFVMSLGSGGLYMPASVATGAAGVVEFGTTDGDVAGGRLEAFGAFGVGTADFAASARVAVVARAALDTVANFGAAFRVAGDASSRWIVAGNDLTTWRIYDTASVWTDTHVTVTDDALTLLEVVRRGGTTYILIDGVEVSSAADSGAYANALVTVRAKSITGQAANQRILRVDSMALAM